MILLPMKNRKDCFSVCSIIDADEKNGTQIIESMGRKAVWKKNRILGDKWYDEVKRDEYDGDLFRVFDKMTGEGILDSDGVLLGDRLFKHISEFNDRGLAVVEDWKNGLAVISSDFDLLCEWGVSPARANVIMRGDE